MASLLEDVVVESYCNFCGSEKHQVVTTNDGKKICLPCTSDPRLRFCEICGSTTDYLGQHPDNQKHYNELCFK